MTVDINNRGDTLEILSGLVIVERVADYKEQSDKPANAEHNVPESEDRDIGLASRHYQRILPDTKVRLAHLSVKEYLESKRILQSDA